MAGVRRPPPAPRVGIARRFTARPRHCSVTRVGCHCGCASSGTYRELLYFLVWREIKVRYKQTALGVAWAIVQPLFTMLVFSIFFGRLARMPSDGVPYPVFTLCALIPWQLFAFALTESSNSVVVNQRLITKVYFPRLVMPLAALGVGLVDFVAAFCPVDRRRLFTSASRCRSRS